MLGVVGEVEGTKSGLVVPALLKKFWISELFSLGSALVGGVNEGVGGVGLAVEVDGVGTALLALAELEAAC